MNLKEFIDKIKSGWVPDVGICGIGGEKLNPILDKVDGETMYVTVDGKKVAVCSDHYFSKLGDEIEKHPIYCHHPVRGC